MPFPTFLAAAAVALSVVAVAPVRAETAPDALVKQISTDVIDAARADAAIQAGDVKRVLALVETKVMPHVNFEVVTRSAVGPQWRGASAEQRQRLQTEFKTLLVRAYSGAMQQIGDQTVHVTRTQPVSGSTQVIVQSEVRGRGEPVKLDYRLDKQGDAWKIIDVNVGGLWLVQNYRTQFAQELSRGGVDALIQALAARNQGGK